MGRASLGVSYVVQLLTALHFPLDEWPLPVILRRFKAAAEFWFEGTRSSEEAEFVDAAERLSPWSQSPSGDELFARSSSSLLTLHCVWRDRVEYSSVG
jgi:hypothetical protein